MHSSFLQTFLAMCWRALGQDSGVLIPLYWVGFWSTIPFLNLINAYALYHDVLNSRSQNKDFCPRKLLPYPSKVPFSNRILLLLTACYYQGSLVGRTVIWLFVFETQTLVPYLQGFYSYIFTPLQLVWLFCEKRGMKYLPNQWL